MVLGKSGRFKMIEVQPKGCTNELNFGYNTKMEGYTNSSSDIPKLAEILLGALSHVYYKSIYNNKS
uniref:Uncharacterized protein n=1 Tax=Candidatus Methanophagaceae archaeon ANME-1 ERB6 TaxID=2759912 RepID=A0A7G9Z170_9EURY|nr:hypothetical protein OHMBFCMF_00023 [Methanosarcinales archaeon ANME-1 ERB6]